MLALCYSTIVLLNFFTIPDIFFYFIRYNSIYLGFFRWWFISIFFLPKRYESFSWANIPYFLSQSLVKFVCWHVNRLKKKNRNMYGMDSAVASFISCKQTIFAYRCYCSWTRTQYMQCIEISVFFIHITYRAYSIVNLIFPYFWHNNKFVLLLLLLLNFDWSAI